MSISGSLSNALSGLSASSRAAELVSNNVANALTEGYGRREINLSANVVGGAGAGVRVDGVSRVVDQVILQDRRFADADLGQSLSESEFLEGIETLLGTPDQGDSLSSWVQKFEAALIEASGRPDSSARLQSVVDAANGMTAKFNSISDGIQSARLAADGKIADQVQALNSALQQVEELNSNIVSLSGSGRDVSGLIDQRQQVVDRIASVLPIREIERENGQIALYTTTGATLIDGPAGQFGFSEANLITPDMTQASGALSGITLNGRDLDTSGQYSPVAGGSLSALFAIRDESAITSQVRIDAVARDLVTRFETPGTDPTIAPGQPALFTDAGAAFDPLNEIGLAGRLELNALVDPGQGGQSWRLRDGLGAATQGDVGSSNVLNALTAALNNSITPASGNLTGTAGSLSDLTGALVSLTGTELATSEQRTQYVSAQQTSLRSLELAGGVDTDQEMQKLLLIEQSYAANARVIQTVDEMIQTLLRI